MKRINIFLFLLAGICFPFKLSAQDYDIRFKIHGLHDTVCLLANYYGSGTYIKDTLKVDASGKFSYHAPAGFPRGVYIIVLNDKNFFELIINNDRKFSMETERGNLIGAMKITSSPENKLFYEYMEYNRVRYGDLQKLQNRLKTSGKKDSADMEGQIRDINKDIIRYKLDMAQKNPSSFMAFMIHAMQEPEVPEAPVLPNGRRDSTFFYKYFKAHFWDGTDFTDDRLLRTPVFSTKLTRYFDQILIQNTDTLIKECDRLIALSKPNSDMFKYMVWFMTSHYETSEIMGFDRIFVHIIDTYYATGQATWVNRTVLENILRKANRIRPLLIGETAPNMIMLDTNNHLVSMNSIVSRYLILLFWDPDCGHCEQELPKLKSIYDRLKETMGLEIFAVCSDSSMVKWKNAIIKKKMSWINVDGPRTITGDYHELYDITTTPVIYILNEKKQIIAKNLPVERIEDFLQNFERLKKGR
ncbi:MAG: DUF5106 domain-containing protein [Bacteroidota bacterium]|nr:DUF5106 domain-containing protein [Bacteroidota bacterium]